MRLLKLPEVSRLTGIPRSSVYWRIARGEFPPPIKIGARSSAWSSEAVDGWIARKIEAANAKGAA
jgi:prophage regulatory protein